METTNIYDFLHLLNLIWILGGDLAFAHNATIDVFFLFFLKESVERLTSEYQSKKQGTHHGFYSFNFFKLGFN
jgi:hypothetical protein